MFYVSGSGVEVRSFFRVLVQKLGVVFRVYSLGFRASGFGIAAKFDSSCRAVMGAALSDRGF